MVDNIPTNFDLTTSDRIRQIVQDGRENFKTDDEIIVEIVQSKLAKFSVAVKEFKRALVDLGIVENKSEDRSKIKSLIQDIDNLDLKFEHGDDLFREAQVKSDQYGLSVSKVLSAIKKAAKSKGVVLPSILKPKTKKEKGWAGSQTKVFNFILENKDIGIDALIEKLPDLGKKVSDKKKELSYRKTYEPILELLKRAKV